MFDLKDFVSKLCSSRTGYDFLPKQQLTLNLEDIAAFLRKETTFHVEAETPQVLLLEIDSVSTSLFKSGKILVKDIKEEAEAKKIAEKLVAQLQAYEFDSSQVDMTSTPTKKS
jgi:ArsR family metal-binding transcriptional regulator